MQSTVISVLGSKGEKLSSSKMLVLNVRRWVRAHQVLPMSLCLSLLLLTLPLCLLCLTLLSLSLLLPCSHIPRNAMGSSTKP